MSREKRNFERVCEGSAVRIGRGSARLTGRLRDVSVDGASISTRLARGLRPDEDIEVAIASGVGAGINGRLRVTWQGSDACGGHWVELDSEDMARLRRLMVRQMGDGARVREELDRLARVRTRAR